MCTHLKMKKNTVVNNKIYPVWSKAFAQKSNHNRHVNIVNRQDLADNIAFDESDNQHDKQEQNQTMLSMVSSIETVPSEVPQVSPPRFPPITQKRKMLHLTKMKLLNHQVQLDTKKKQSRLERTLFKIKLQFNYLMSVTESV